MVVAIGYRDRTQAAYRSARSENAAKAKEIARDAEEIARLAREAVAYAAGRSGVGALMEGKCDPEIAAIRESMPEFGNVGFIDRSGRLACSVIGMPPEGVSLDAAPWFAPALEAGATRVSGAFFNPLIKQWAAVFTHPVRDAGGGVVGIAALAVDLSRFGEAVSAPPLPEGGLAAIVDATGAVIARSPPAANGVGRPLPESHLLARAVTSSRASPGEREDALSGPIVTVVPVGDTHWRVIATVPESAALAHAVATAQRNAAFVAALLLAVFVALAGLVTRLVRPMERLAQAARSAADRAGVRAELSGPSEVRMIASRLNDLLDSCEVAQARLREVIQNAPDAIVVVDAESGLFVEANARAEEFFGLDREALLATGPAALSPPVQPDGRASDAAARERIGQALAGMGPVFEWMHRNAAGELIDCEVRLVLMPATGRGLVRGSIVDIRARKRTEERLARVTRLYAALSHTNEALVRADDPPTLYAEICRIAVEDGGIRMAWIGLVDGDSGLVVPVASYGETGDYFTGLRISVDPGLPEGRGATGTAIRERRNVVFNDYEAEPATLPWRERARKARFRALAAIPLQRAGTPIGALNLHAHERGFFDAEIVELLGDMALDIAYALDKMESDCERERAVVALVASEGRLREVLETIPLLAVSLDAQARITFCNDALLSLTGWTREEALGADWFERFIAPENEAVREMFRGAFATGEFAQHFENDILTRHGGRRLIRWSNTLIYSGGRVVGTTSLGEDVTVHRRAQDALRESEARFRSLMDGVPDIPVQGFDRHRRVIFWNSASERLYGYSAAEASGRPIEELLVPDGARGEFVRDIAAWMDEGREIPTGEFRLMRKDGSLVDVFASPVMVRNGQGEPEVYCLDVDLTELHRMEAALRESEERFRSVVAGLSEGVMLFDTEGRLLLCNEAATRLLGTPAEAMQGRNPLAGEWSRNFVRQDGSALPAGEIPLAVALRTGQPSRNVVMGVETAGGRRIWLEMSAQTITPGGDTQAVLVSFADVSQRHAAEQEVRAMNLVLERRVAARTAELETANRELESFSYSISHDLRTPLRAIDGFSAVLAEEEGERFSPGARDLLGRIRVAAGRMARMIDDLLELAHIGRAAVERRDLDLSRIVAEIAEELSRKDPGRACEWTIAPGVRAQADEGLARNVMENLLENAWRYTSRRELAKIEFGVQSDRGGRLVYFVKDNGAGFDPAHAHKLFGAFQRLHADREFPGHGIGLATVRRIVQRHGGRVWGEGAVGQGATFCFTLGSGRATVDAPS